MKTNIMKTIEIDGKSYLIDTEKAAEQGLLKEKDSKPRSWEEYVKMAETVQIVPCDVYANYFDKKDQGRRITYDVFNSEEEARAFCVLGKLIQLRDAWWGEWRPNYAPDCTADNINYNIVCAAGNEMITKDNPCYVNRILSFPTPEMAMDFLNTFRDMIEEAKMFL